MNKSRGKNTEHSKKMGQFDRSAFKQSGERIFDEKFSFERGLTETFRYANTLKKGSLEQRIAIHAKKRNQETWQKLRPDEKQQQDRQALTYLKMLEQVNYLQMALGRGRTDESPAIPRKKKKKRTGKQQQDQELSL